MPGSSNHPKVSLHVASGRDVRLRVAQLLALGELMGPSWLRGTLRWIQLLHGRTVRIVLCVPHGDLQKVLSVDNCACLYKCCDSECRKPLKTAHIPPYLYAEDWSGGAQRSNMSMAKSLSELLLLLLMEMNRAAALNDFWEEAFWHTLCRADYHNKPPVLSDGQCEGLMEMADAWRDHIASVWAQPGMTAFKRFSRQPPLTEKVLDEEMLEKPGTAYIKFKPSDFPKLGASLGDVDPNCPFKPVAPVDKSEAWRLWKVAWLDQSRQARMWLGCGASPQSMADRD